MKYIYLTIFILFFSNSMNAEFNEFELKQIIKKEELNVKVKKLPLIDMRRTGANIATDFNNPGCLRIPTDAPRIKALAIGHAYGKIKKQGTYLVFNTIQDGFLALQYWCENHAKYKLEHAMKIFAPKFENNLLKYVQDLCSDLSVTKNTLIKNINTPALMAAIAKYEGWEDNTISWQK